MRLAEKYGDKPAEELPLLFQRILQNATRDYFRRTKVRSFWTTLFSSMGPDSAEADNADFDPLETLEAQEGSKQAESAYDEVARSQVMALIKEGIEKLPVRQREAFMLRY